MRIRWRILACLCLGGLLVWFLADAGAVRDSVAEALALCARSVVPSLFPFLVASSALLALGFGELAAPWLAGLMEPLFRVPGAGSAALVLGLVGGYPIGAKTAADLYRENLVSREEAERLLAFCNNSNPVFLISVLGVGVFGSVRAGVWLWLIHVLSALLTGLVFRGSGKSASRQELTRHPPFQAVSFAEAFTGAVRSSLAGILSVCAFVVFFYVLAQPLTAMGGRLGAVLVAALELFSLTPLLTADAFGFLLAAAAAGWGGLSVLCQTLAVLEGSGLRLCACGEHPQAADSVGINVYRMRYAGVLISGVLGGLGGIVYIIAGVSEWKFENGVAGFGFLALAVMIFGQWKPTRIALAALLFGFFRALGNVYSGFDLLSNLNLPSSVYNMLPYVISLVVLAFTSQKSRAPKAEGIPYDKGQR